MLCGVGEVVSEEAEEMLRYDGKTIDCGKIATFLLFQLKPDFTDTSQRVIYATNKHPIFISKSQERLMLVIAYVSLGAVRGIPPRVHSTLL